MIYHSRAELERIGRAGAALWPNAPEGFAARYLSAFWLYLEENDEAFTPHAKDGFWEAWISVWMSKQFENHDHFVDVGANVGYYSMMAADAGLDVSAVEPIPHIAKMVEASSRLNRFDDRVAVHQAVLTNKRGNVKLSIPAGHSGGSHISTTGIDVVAETFDWLFAGYSVDMLIKVDAEGAEPLIWDGMRRSWMKNNHTLILEWESVRFDTEAFGKALLAGGQNHVWYVDFAGNEIPLVHWRQLDALPGLQMVVVRKAS